MSKQKKQQEILACAKELFGQYGYDKVSMREIAERPGISVGNLTYYYNRKENLMLAVLKQITERLQDSACVPVWVADVDMLLEQFSDLIGQNSCLFRRYNVAPELAEQLHRCQKLIAETHRAIWRRAVNALVENGRMAQELYPGQYDELIAAIQMVYRYWDGYADMESSIGNAYPQFKQCVWSLLLPNLTEIGRVEFFADVMPRFASACDRTRNAL